MELNFKPCSVCGDDTSGDPLGDLECRQREIGKKWLENSSLEAWFPITAEELQLVKKERSIWISRCSAYVDAEQKYGTHKDLHERLVFLESLINKLRDITPIRPKAITWEQGVEILNFVQDVLLPSTKQ